MKKAAPLTAVAALAVLSVSAPTMAEEVDQPAMEVDKTQTVESTGPWLPDIPELFDRLLGFVWGGP